MVRKEHLIGLGAFAALLCLMVVLYAVSSQPGIAMPASTGSYTQHGGPGYESVPVQIADPSHLPRGTSALWVTFSNVSVYSQAERRWVGGGGYGPVNLMAQANQSVTVSSVDIPFNSIISAARLNVSSATMTVNGTSYNVVVPGGAMATNISNAEVRTGKALLVELSPFVLSSSGASKRVSLGYSSRGYIVNGSGAGLGQSSPVILASALPVTPYANISIGNAVVATSGGVTTVRVTVVNHSNRPVRIGSVTVLGKQNFTQNSSAIAAIAKGYADEIVAKYASSVQSSSPSGTAAAGSGLIGELFNASASGVSAGISSGIYSKALGFGANLTNIVYSNVSALAQLAGPLPRSLLTGSNSSALRATVYQNIYSGLLNASVQSSDAQSNLDSLGFVPSDDGSLSQLSESDNSSYYLEPNSTATLDYTGQVSLDNTTSVSLPSDDYQVFVAGDNGTAASYDVNYSDD
jgi:hypothetical protein